MKTPPQLEMPQQLLLPLQLIPLVIHFSMMVTLILSVLLPSLTLKAMFKLNPKLRLRLRPKLKLKPMVKLKLVQEHGVAPSMAWVEFKIGQQHIQQLNQHKLLKNQQLVLFTLMVINTHHTLTQLTLVTMVVHGIILFKDATVLLVSEVFGVIKRPHALHVIVVLVKSLTALLNAFVKLDGLYLIVEDIAAVVMVTVKLLMDKPDVIVRQDGLANFARLKCQI